MPRTILLTFTVMAEVENDEAITVGEAIVEITGAIFNDCSEINVLQITQNKIEILPEN